MSELYFQDTREITLMFLVFDFLRTVVFLSKLWEAILCVDKLPENATTDKLNTNMCEQDIMEIYSNNWTLLHLEMILQYVLEI